MATSKPEKPEPLGRDQGSVPTRSPDTLTSANAPRRTFVEQQLVDDLARLRGRPLTEQEANFAIAQARAFGEL